MRVLFTHERFAPDFAGGGELVVLETAKHLRQLGIDCEVLTTGDPAIREYDGISTTRLRRSRYLMNLAASAIARRAESFDLIQTFNYHACLPSYLAGKRAKKPVVCTILALFGPTWRVMKGPLLGRAWEAWERMLVRLPYDHTVYVSESSRSLGVSLGADPKHASVIAPGIDTSAYKPAAQKEDIVLFSGKLESRKGIETVLAVAKQLPEIPFRVFGWGDDGGQYHTRATENIEFVPFERDAPLREQFARARLFLFPSRAETFGMVVLEAMASGCAIISSAPVDFAGVQVQSDDIDGIARAVRELWTSRKKTDEIGAENVRRAQEYSWTRYAEELAKVYRAVLEQKSMNASNKVETNG